MTTKEAQESIEDVLLGGAVTISWIQDHVLGLILTVGSIFYLYYKIRTQRLKVISGSLDNEIKLSTLKAYDALIESFNQGNVTPGEVKDFMEEKSKYEQKIKDYKDV